MDLGISIACMPVGYKVRNLGPSRSIIRNLLRYYRIIILMVISCSLPSKQTKAVVSSIWEEGKVEGGQMSLFRIRYQNASRTNLLRNDGTNRKYREPLIHKRHLNDQLRPLDS